MLISRKILFLGMFWIFMPEVSLRRNQCTCPLRKYRIRRCYLFLLGTSASDNRMTFQDGLENLFVWFNAIIHYQNLHISRDTFYDFRGTKKLVQSFWYYQNAEMFSRACSTSIMFALKKDKSTASRMSECFLKVHRIIRIPIIRNFHIPAYTWLNLRE